LLPLLGNLEAQCVQSSNSTSPMSFPTPFEICMLTLIYDNVVLSKMGSRSRFFVANKGVMGHFRQTAFAYFAMTYSASSGTKFKEQFHL
jgi:hypothetical protein